MGVCPVAYQPAMKDMEYSTPDKPLEKFQFTTDLIHKF